LPYSATTALAHAPATTAAVIVGAVGGHINMEDHPATVYSNRSIDHKFNDIWFSGIRIHRLR
jgi:hypothetical protein